MPDNIKITTIFTDLGNVLLSNGWDRKSRRKAIEYFQLNQVEIEERHHLTFDTYEVGKLTLDEYLERVVFYEKRDFDKSTFRQFMLDQSEAYLPMIELIKKLKAKFNLKIAVVNNEGRELNNYRIQKFKLTEFVDFFISSSFVHFRKPDVDIFKLALDVAQKPVEEILYLDDREMFVQVAESIGIKGIAHKSIEDTTLQLKKYGLEL